MDIYVHAQQADSQNVAAVTFWHSIGFLSKILLLFLVKKSTNLSINEIRRSLLLFRKLNMLISLFRLDCRPRNFDSSP